MQIIPYQRHQEEPFGYTFLGALFALCCIMNHDHINRTGVVRNVDSSCPVSPLRLMYFGFILHSFLAVIG